MRCGANVLAVRRSAAAARFLASCMRWFYVQFIAWNALQFLSSNIAGFPT